LGTFAAGLSLLTLLAGCASEASKAEDRYRIVSKAGSPADICKAAREVADVHLQARDQQKYSVWKLYADVDCQSAALGSAATRVGSAY
jgi:hypothetical protein